MKVILTTFVHRGNGPNVLWQGALIYFLRYMRNRERKTSERGVCWWVCTATPTEVIVLENYYLANRALFLISSFKSLNYFKNVVEIKLNVLSHTQKDWCPLKRNMSQLKFKCSLFIIVISLIPPHLPPQHIHTGYNWKYERLEFWLCHSDQWK